MRPRKRSHDTADTGEPAPVVQESPLLEQHCEAVFHRCYRLLRDRELAYDATQETLARYFETCKTQQIQKPLHYLYRISTNHCLDLLAHYNKHLPLEPGEDGLPQATLSSTTQPNAESKFLVRELIEVFGRDNIDLLSHRYIDRLSYVELGHMYGLSDRGIQKRVNKLEDKIRRHLSR